MTHRKLWGGLAYARLQGGKKERLERHVGMRFLILCQKYIKTSFQISFEFPMQEKIIFSPFVERFKSLESIHRSTPSLPGKSECGAGG